MARLKIDVTPSLQRLDLIVKGQVNTKFMGNYASAFKGQGLEFADYRTYTPSDDAKLIDWRASNRARKLLVKEFVEERNINVIFILDVSSKMLLGSVNKLKGEYAAELVASLSHTILKTGDYVGLVMYNDGVNKMVFPSNGMKHFHVISDSLSNLANYGGIPNTKKVLDYVLKNFEQGSLVVLISDFIGAVDYQTELRLASKKFDLIGMMVRDPTDIDLPEGMGQVLLEDPYTGERLLVSPNKLKKAYSSEAKKEINQLRKVFRDSGADFLDLYTNRSFVKDLVMFFERRKSEWR